MKLIPLSRGESAMVDDEDFEKLNQFNWFVDNSINRYASRSRSPSDPGRERMMHRFILNPPKEMQIDHIDGDGFNNQKSNLRICTQGNNNKNRVIQKHSTPFKGVAWHKRNKKFVAYIRVDGKRTYLGSFHNPILAAVVYDLEALEKFGEFSKTNQQMGAY